MIDCYSIIARASTFVTMERMFLERYVLLVIMMAGMAFAENAPPLSLAEEKEDFIRVESLEKKKFLQTAVIQYEKGGVQVDLIGAVHIADEGYYKELNKRFDDYEVLLFEMVGGESIKKWAKMSKKKRQENVSALALAYEGMAKMLDLGLQHHEIDYFKPHFVHADLTHQEFTRMQNERNETIFGYAVKAQRENEKRNVKQPSSWKLMVAMLAKKPNSIKRELMESLAMGDENMGHLSGESVIIDDRNAKCLEVLEKQVKAGKKHFGIFYGAAHFPAMTKSLVELGYEKKKTVWLNAWEVDLEK